MGEQVAFYGFGYGEWGAQASYLVGFAVLRQHLLYKGWFSGQNVVRTLDGAIIPMPQPKAKTTSGLPVAGVDWLGFGYNSNGDRVTWAKENGGLHIYQAPSGGYAFAAFAGTLTAGDVDITDTWQAGQVTYALVGAASGTNLYRIDHVAKTLTLLNNFVGATALCVYGERLIVTEDATQKVYYSAAGDFSSWPAQNYFSVGDATPVTCVFPQRNRLVLGKGRGGDSQWWVLSGVPGVNDVLRQAATAPAPKAPGAAALLTDDTIGFWPAGQSTFSSGSVGGNYPCIFNGSAVARMRHLKPDIVAAFGGYAHVYPLQQPGDWLAFDGLTGYLHREGAWTFHDWTGLSLNGAVASDPQHDVLGIYNTATNKIHEWKGSHQRPALSGDPSGTAPDASTCKFSLPEWWTRGADEVAVKAVVVDFRKYATGDTQPNTFTVEAVPMRIFTTSGDGLVASPAQANSDGDGIIPQARTFSEAAAASSADGTRGRYVAKFSPQFGNGFRLDFSNLRGVAIEKIVVALDEKAAPGI